MDNIFETVYCKRWRIKDKWLMSTYVGILTTLFCVNLLTSYIQYSRRKTNYKNSIVNETYWTDENIWFWSRLDIPISFDLNNDNETVTDMLNRMSLFQNEALKRKATCIPRLKTFELAHILTPDTIDLLLLDEDETQRLNQMKIYVKRCEVGDGVCYPLVTRCLPKKNVRQDVKYIQIKMKKKSSSQKIASALNNSNIKFHENRNIIYFPIEEHIHCSCQCLCNNDLSSSSSIR